MDFKIIDIVIDRYFEFMEKLDANHYILDLIPTQMLDFGRPSRTASWGAWKPITSSVTNEQIVDLEDSIGYKFPNSYRYFLRYRHFIEMNLGDQPINFFKNLPDEWNNVMLQQMSQFPPSLKKNGFDAPLERGYIPFADMSDYGLACFDTNKTPLIENEFPLIWLDHEDGYQSPQPLSPGFIALFQDFKAHLDAWIAERK